MHPETIRELLHATPFQPFTIHLAGGQSYDIDHPDFVAFNQSRTVLIVITGHSKVNSLSLASIARIESTAAPTAS